MVYQELKKFTVNKQVVYIPSLPNYIKFEIDVDKGQYNKKAWRILINKNSPASMTPTDLCKIPIQIRKGKVLDMYDLYLDSLFKPKQVQTEQGPKEEPHPTLVNMMNFIKKNSKNINYFAKISDIYASRGDSNSDISWSILSIDQFLGQPFPNSDLEFINPNESDLLGLEDLSNINFKSINVPSDKINEINTLLHNMGLDLDYPRNNNSYSIRELIEIYSGLSEIKDGKFPLHSGIALYGPPGTGKTHLMEESLKKIFKDKLNFGWHQVEIGAILSNPYVGGFAANISKLVFEEPIKHIKQNRTPCFIYVDEATDLLQSADHEWLKQGIEAMKSFINKKRYPGIILCLSSNMKLDDMDDALTREGRLKPIEIPLPSAQRCKQIWEYVNNNILFKSEEFRFNSNEIERLVELTSNKINIASITEISSSFRLTNKLPEDGKIEFDFFIKKFGNEVLALIEKEHNRVISNFKKMGSGTSYIEMDEIKIKKEKENSEYRKRVNEIKRALDPSTPSNLSLLDNIFKLFSKDKENIPKKYKKLKEDLSSWFRIATNSGVKNESILNLTKQILINLNFLNKNLSIEKYGQIKEVLDLITKLLNTLLFILENPNDHSKIFDIQDLSRLDELIKILPNDLNQINIYKSDSGIIKSQE